VRLPAFIGAGLLIVIAVFQIALALGMPARNMAWGGRYEGKLPVGLRVASGVAGIVIYPLAALLVLEAGGITDFELVPNTGPIGMWVMAVLFALAAILNFVSRSREERIWGPVALAISVCCGIVAASL
jgi:hypothetical protein